MKVIQIRKRAMSNLIELINENHKIAIIAHVNPDGDSVSSILALGLALKKMNKEVEIILNDSLPGKFSFLPGKEYLVAFDDRKNTQFDICFVLDCGSKSRVKNGEELFAISSNIINIDHHVSNDYFGDINIVDLEASSTSEIIYNVIENDLEVKIDKDIATCLHTGLMSDTGNFTYVNATSRTFYIASKLLEQGVDIENISYHLHQSKSLNSVKLLGNVLESIEFYLDNRLAIISYTDKQLLKYNATYLDTDGMINYARDIKGVEVAITLYEFEKNKVKISARSKKHFDVNNLVNQFNGGGHVKAAGAVISGNLDEVKVKLKEAVKKSFEINKLTQISGEMN
ncbi:bifunctional oligoribonuclease/PAP phosphatase NrnA [Alkaliphilus transvaalensis]|nr:bifunctional oligoribonuclease/PAP phosphatase NrnA [Alkaliphilus transvaalensis]